jgi:hypothetical protein
MAEQIDIILQELKFQDPALSSRIIRLRQNPAGGLHIEVDGELYEEPGEIEDKAVQKLIRQAVHIPGATVNKNPTSRSRIVQTAVGWLYPATATRNGSPAARAQPGGKKAALAAFKITRRSAA